MGRFVPEMTYYVSSGTLNFTKLKLLVDVITVDVFFPWTFLPNTDYTNTVIMCHALSYIMHTYHIHCGSCGHMTPVTPLLTYF